MVLFWSCGLKGFENLPADENQDTTVFQEDSSLFQKEEGSSVFDFETNESKYLTEYGYTLWTSEFKNESETFEPVSVKVCKISGNKDAGYGIVFCSQEIDKKPYLLTVLITAGGFYSVGKVVDGVFNYILTSKSSSSIKSGYGVYNSIAVSYDAESKDFLLKFNGIQTDRFSVTDNLVFKESSAGFVTVISDREKFPESPVKVTFEKL